MRKLYKVLKDWASYKTSDVVEFEDSDVKSLVESGILADAGEGVDSALVSKAIESLTKGIGEAVAKATEAAVASATKAVSVRVDAGESQWDKEKRFGDYLQSVYKAHSPFEDSRRAANERLQKLYGVTKRLDETTGSAGGFAIPVTYSQEIFKIVDEGAVFAQYTTPKTMVTPEHIFPALLQTSNPSSTKASAYHAGVKLYYKSEKAQRTQSDLQFDQITLKAQDLTGMTEITRDAMRDAAALESEVRDAFGRAISWRKDLEYLFGTGNGSPLGALSSNNPALKTVSRTTSNEFKYTDVLSMYAAMITGGLSRCYWYMSQTMIPQLGQLKDANNNSVFVANYAGGARDAMPMTLLGRPIIFSEKMSALGTLGDVALLAPAYYYDGMLDGLEIGMSEHFKWDEDAISFRFKLRHDGQPALKGAVKLSERRTSSNTTVSPFVILAA